MKNLYDCRNNNTKKNISQQKCRINIQKIEVEAEEYHKKSQDHLNSMPQSLPTQKTSNSASGNQESVISGHW